MITLDKVDYYIDSCVHCHTDIQDTSIYDLRININNNQSTSVHLCKNCLIDLKKLIDKMLEEANC